MAAMWRRVQDIGCRARPQKIALKAVIEEGGTDLRSAAVLARYGIAASTMHKMLKVLDSRGLVREEETIGSNRYRLSILRPMVATGAGERVTPHQPQQELMETRAVIRFTV